ncbi:hypothetical protein [Shewanella colwelliana]|uniref:hypothetical protein n=1 Tax=Shewanella colwelliana TaxID=23 RepID=UPI001BB91105|nr:hypothetical protein [Shewanella colwelliana]MCZ4336308.1 hypothetical protein [Shewanella colwelliana]GIU24287.1 hypothetical protein TUM4644_18610 [Shewanella colwelliana]
MTWFISAFIIASAIFMFAPKKLAVNNATPSHQAYGQKVLLAIPLVALMIFSLNVLSGYSSPQAVVAISFALTGCSVAMTSLHRFIIPCAGVTAVALVLMVIQLL